MDVLRLVPLLLLLPPPSVAALDFGYHHTESMEAFLRAVHKSYASITHLYSIGKSAQGREGRGAARSGFPGLAEQDTVARGRLPRLKNLRTRTQYTEAASLSTLS